MSSLIGTQWLGLTPLTQDSRPGLSTLRPSPQSGVGLLDSLESPWNGDEMREAQDGVPRETGGEILGEMIHNRSESRSGTT